MATASCRTLALASVTGASHIDPSSGHRANMQIRRRYGRDRLQWYDLNFGTADFVPEPGDISFDGLRHQTIIIMETWGPRPVGAAERFLRLRDLGSRAAGAVHRAGPAGQEAALAACDAAGTNGTYSAPNGVAERVPDLTRNVNPSRHRGTSSRTAYFLTVHQLPGRPPPPGGARIHLLLETE